jgi:hypothetical protein
MLQTLQFFAQRKKKEIRRYLYRLKPTSIGISTLTGFRGRVLGKHTTIPNRDHTQAKEKAAEGPRQFSHAIFHNADQSSTIPQPTY